jgi:MFS family permease
VKFPFKHHKHNSSHPDRKSERVSLSAWKITLILGAIGTIVMYTEIMVAITIPDIIRDFNISYNASSWILAIYLVVGAIMTPIVGKLSDIHGKKKILFFIIVAYTLGIIIGVFSTNIFVLLIARAIQGIGISFFPPAVRLVKEIYPPKKIPIVLGIFSHGTMFGFGAILGILIGAPMTQYYGLNIAYLFILPIIFPLLFLLRRVDVDDRKVKMTKKTDPLIPKELSKKLKSLGKNIKEFAIEIDVKGALTLTVTVTSFLLLLTSFELRKDPFITNAIIYLIIGVGSFILFIIVERKSRSPLFDLNLLRNKTILASDILGLGFGFWTFIVYYTFPIIAKNPPPLGYGLESVNIPFLLLPFAIVSVVFGPTSGFIVSKIGSVKPIIIGLIITAIGFIEIAVSNASVYSSPLTLGIISVGISLTNIGSINILIRKTPPESTGISVSMNFLIKLVGSAIGPALAATYMQRYQSILVVNEVAESYPSGESYNLIFISAAMVAVAMIPLVMVLFRVKKLI